MRFEWLFDYVALAKHRNFTDAAKARYSTQPTLSKHIDSLEKDVGCTLLDVSNGTVWLTPAGSLFLDYAQRLLDTYDEAKKKSIELSKRPPVRIASSVAFERIYQAMTRLNQQPFVFVNLDCDEKKKRAALKKGVIDVFYRWGGTVSGRDSADRKQTASLQSDGTTVIDDAPWKMVVGMMRDNPRASEHALSREALKDAVVEVNSGQHFDSWKQTVLDVVGDDLGIQFRYIPKNGQLDIATADLEDRVIFCSHEAIENYYAKRDDMVFFDQVDGTSLEFPGAFICLTKSKPALEFVAALKEAIEHLA